MDSTNAERQRRYRVTRKAAAADSASLRQENTALRQQITDLKQELAQQQAKAKAARPEGLAIKAMKAAMTKPNGGVVGFHDANFEFHEALSLAPHPLTFLPWVPEEARPILKIQPYNRSIHPPPAPFGDGERINLSPRPRHWRTGRQGRPRSPPFADREVLPCAISANAKAMARSLRAALAAKAVETSHSESLELIAKAFGYENWNILSAKIDAVQPRSNAAAGH
jgi:Glyoxalase superfamily protein